MDVVDDEVFCGGSLNNSCTNTNWVPFDMKLVDGRPPAQNVMCWHCCCNASSPCSLPMQYDELNDKFTVMGFFCCLQCALGYAIERKYHNMTDIGIFINIMAQKMKLPVPVRPARPPFWLKQFGGPMTIEEFREETPANLHCLEQPMISYSLAAGVAAQEGQSAPVAQTTTSMPRMNTSSHASGIYHDFYTENERKEARRPVVENDQPKRVKVEKSKGGLSSFIKQ